METLSDCTVYQSFIHLLYLNSVTGQNGLRGSTSTSSSVPRERVRGTGVKDCPYCGKAFRSSHHLKVHLRVHTGKEKRCMCKKSLTRINNDL